MHMGERPLVFHPPFCSVPVLSCRRVQCHGGVASVLQVCLKYYEHEFVELACQCPAVVCCRCSPTQKAHIVTLLRQHTGRRTCAIGESPWASAWPGEVEGHSSEI